MKILINHGHLTTELTSTPNETWGQFTQRFVEHSLLHPPQLLQLLVDILNYSNDENNDKGGGGVISECSYRLRYGDGYGTLIKPTWNATGSVVAGEDDGNSIIEANITLKPKSGSSLADAASSSNFSGLVIDDESEQIEVDLCVEKIGLSSSKNGKQKKKKKTTTNTEGGSVLFGNMTQTPFPINVKRVHVLHVVEHSLFKGVIDSYSLSKPDDEEDISNGGVGETSSKSVSEKKRKENPAAAATETSSGGAKKGRSEETTSDAKSTSVTASSILQKAHDLAASMKEKDAQGASSSSSSKKKQTIANDGGEKVGNDTIDDSAAKKKKSAATPKKTTADDAASEQSPKKSTTDKSSEKKKKKKSTKKKKADDVDVAEEATDKSPAKKKARKSTDGDDDAKEKEGKDFTPDAKSTSVTASSILQKAHDLAASMKKKDTQGASSSSSSNKEPNDGGEKVGDDTIDDSAAKKKKSAVTPKKNTVDDAATKQSPKKSTADKSSEKKKKKKSTKKKKADNVDVAEEATDKSPAKKKARKSTGGDDDDNEKEGKEAAAPIPKRPLNAYQRFANDMRPKIMKDNPDIKFGEVSKKISEMYRELTPHQLQMYKDKADAEVAKFKELHGEDAMKITRKKKEVINDSVESTPVATVVATGKKDGSGEDESKGDDAAKKSRKKKKKEKKKEKTGDQKAGEKKDKEDLPSGWKVESKPRSNGKGIDKYYFSPVKAYKFPSEAQVRVFLSVLEREDGDEARAHQVYTENRKKKKKSSATDSNKKKSKKTKISDEEGENAAVGRDNSKAIIGVGERGDSDSDDDAMHKAAWDA